MFCWERLAPGCLDLKVSPSTRSRSTICNSFPPHCITISVLHNSIGSVPSQSNLSVFLACVFVIVISPSSSIPKLWSEACARLNAAWKTRSAGVSAGTLTLTPGLSFANSSVLLAMRRLSARAKMLAEKWSGFSFDLARRHCSGVSAACVRFQRGSSMEPVTTDKSVAMNCLSPW